MGAPSAERVWRLRRLGRRVDAEIRAGTGTGVEVRYFIDGRLTDRRTWATRGEALAHAAEKRAELERDGWLLHW